MDLLSSYEVQNGEKKIQLNRRKKNKVGPLCNICPSDIKMMNYIEYTTIIDAIMY